MSEPTLKPGDSVQLKNGDGPVMIVMGSTSEAGCFDAFLGQVLGVEFL